MSKAIHPEDATEEEIEEMSRKVRDLVNYLAKYDDPNFKEKLGGIKNPEAVMILIQTKQKFDRGLAIGVALTAVGNFNPVAIATMVRDWLMEAEQEAMLGKEII